MSTALQGLVVCKPLFGGLFSAFDDCGDCVGVLNSWGAGPDAGAGDSTCSASTGDGVGDLAISGV